MVKITPVKTPIVAKKAFPNFIWHVDTTEKELYLTFDDGPTPDITDWTLNILKEFSAEATFFCIGSNIEKYPDIFRRIINEGHSIGNHTQHHVKGWKTLRRDYLADIHEAENAIQNHSKLIQERKLFRPPYGQIKPKQGRALIKLGYDVVMWDVLSFDWDQNVSAEQCLTNVLSKSQPGSIIVFHDSIKASKNMMKTLPAVLEEFSNRGFTFKALR